MKDERRFHAFAPIRLLRYLDEYLGLPPIILSALEKFLLTIQDLLGLELGFEVPEHFLLYDPELWGGLIMAGRLKEEGIIASFKKINKYFPDEPNIIRYRSTREGGKSLGSGHDFFSEKKSFWSAIGESIERYALSGFLPKEGEYRDASFKEIKSEALDIFSLAGISKEQREQGHPRFELKFDEDSKFRWIRGQSLVSGKKTWAPLQLVTFAWKAYLDKKEPVLRLPISTGAAAHRTLEEAILNGLMEVIQRDAFMVSWVNKLSPPRIDPASICDEGLQEIFKRFERYNLEFYLLYLQSDIPVHTVLCIILDRTGIGPAVVVGAKTDFEILDAISAAMAEALSSRLSIRLSFEQKKNDPTFRLQDQDKLDREGRLLWWAQPEKIKEIDFFISGEKQQISNFPTSTIPKTPKKKLGYLIKVFRERNMEVIYSEILDKNLAKKIGFRAVMVTVPEMQPMHLDESLPYFSGGKILSAQNILPHPFP